jgi:hypothetical protein
MARIAGVDLPKKKRVEYGLTYIYGIGLHTSRLILDATGIDYNKRVHELSEDDVAKITNEIRENHMVEGDLRKKSRDGYQSADGARFLPRPASPPRSSVPRSENQDKCAYPQRETQNCRCSVRI